MQLIRGLHQFSQGFQGCALTIGNFDGVHLGHQAVLQHLRHKADQLGLPVAVMLFEPQPQEYFLKNQSPARLMRLRDKVHYLQQCGVDLVIVTKFDRTFANLSATDFIQQILVERLNVKFLSIGDDFRFGSGRQGDFTLLQQAGKQFGFDVEDNHSFCLDKLRISSTAIRNALAADDLALAENLLGKPYRIFGRVVQGNRLGRTIGFPTANVKLHRQVNPVRGVYAVKLAVLDTQKERSDFGKFFGVANIGTRPTINGMNQLLEVHLFDFKGDLYGKPVEVEFCHKIRNEQKFPSFEDLRRQIEQDAITAKTFFQNKQN